MVMNLELRDGSATCGVLGVASGGAIILERWEDAGRGPTGDPFTVPIDSIKRIVIP
jgi:hypothetical protein